MDKKEILTIYVEVTGCTVVEEHTNYTKQIISFKGYCESELFQGAIMDGAEDTQEYIDGELSSLRAVYSLDGIDQDGLPAKIHIINEKVNNEYKPIIKTTSNRLRFLENDDLFAILEPNQNGIIVKIYN